jgi:uncharacterized protein with HEPN domain
MPSERLVQCFNDIVVAADLIRKWSGQAGGVDAAIYQDLLIRSAIERQLLVISEAAVRMHKIEPTAGPTLAPDVDWPGIRGIGNFIRHKYDDLDASILADVLLNRLENLRVAAECAVKRLSDNASD